MHFLFQYIPLELCHYQSSDHSLFMNPWQLVRRYFSHIQFFKYVINLGNLISKYMRVQMFIARNKRY